MIVRSLACLIVLSATLARVTPAWSQGDNTLTPAKVAVIEQEVTAALQKYYRLYTEKNAAALGSEVFLDPWIQLGGNGPQLEHSDPETAKKQFATNIARLEAQGWVKSEYPKPIVCVINAKTAIASGEFYRYKQDGSVLSTNGTSYLFGKTDNGWRIVSYFGHEVGKVITCNDGK